MLYGHLQVKSDDKIFPMKKETVASILVGSPLGPIVYIKMSWILFSLPRVEWFEVCSLIHVTNAEQG